MKTASKNTDVKQTLARGSAKMLRKLTITAARLKRVTIAAFFAFRGVVTPPYVALLLLAIGEPRASIAGLLIAAFAMGGVFYSLSVPALIAHVRERHLMVAGAALAATGLVLIALHVPWMWQIAVYGIFGFGFYLLHGCIQVHVTELSQTARGAAASLHSSFFYLGQAVGPVVYGYGFAHGGPEPSIFVGAAVVMTVGIACSRLLRHRTPY